MIKIYLDRAAYVLMRAGYIKVNPGMIPSETTVELARREAANIILTALTGERYDLDFDHLTPEQNRIKETLLRKERFG
jgi:hypothetical protein